MQTVSLPEGQRFSARNQPENAGRTGTAWLRKRLNRAARGGDESEREAIADHLIELARTAEGRDAVEAAKLLYQYDLGKPPMANEEARLALAEHFRKVEADRFQFARELLGEKIKSMTPVQLAEFFSRLAPDVLGFLKMAEAAQAGGAERAKLEASPPEHAGSGDPVSAGQTESPEPGPARSGGDEQENDGRTTRESESTSHATTRNPGHPTP